MQVHEIATLLIALAALVTSGVTAYEAFRHNKNAIRPVLVVLEKYTDNKRPDLGYSLYLINMGQALAMNIRFSANHVELIQDGKIEEQPRTEVAVGRRAVIASEYFVPVFKKISLEASYTDINNVCYRTIFRGGKHEFRNG